MNASPILDNEPARLRETGALGLVGFNSKDPNLADIIRIACAVANTPIAMVNILNRPEMVTLRSVGLPDAVRLKLVRRVEFGSGAVVLRYEARS